MAVGEAPGFRGTVSIGGVTFDRGPMTFDIQLPPAETRQRAKSGRLLTHRLFPYDGAPDRTRKAVIKIAWSSLLGVDIAAVNDLIAAGGPYAFQPWLFVSESFWCAAGVPLSGILSRLDAWTQNGGAGPPGTGTAFQPQYGLTAGARAGAVTIGTVDTVNNRTPWSVPAVTPVAAERAWVAYAPLYTVMVGEEQPSFPQSSQQGQTLTLEEV